MATLTGKKINTTYDGLLKTEDNQPISTTKKKVTDGYGNETGLSVDSLGNVDVSDDLNVLGNAVVTGSTTANSFIKTGGTSSQFLKADGSIDSNTYITSSTDTLDSVTDRGNTTTNAISVGDIQSSGNVAVTGTVDGRDIAADGSKLDGIEAGAEVNDVDSVFGRTGAVVADASDYSSFYPSITDLTTETNARISADTDLANDISTEATTRANNDLILQQNIDAEESARIAADSNLQSQVSTNEGDINNLELTKQDNLTAGTGINIAGNTISNTAPDQTVTLTEGENVTITGTYPNFTIASNDVVGAVSSVSAGTGISVNSTTGAVVVTNTITNNNQLTNGAGYTTNVGDITGVTAGSGISGGGTSGTVTVSHADTSAQGSINNSGATVIQDVTLDTYGHVTGLGSKTITLADLGYTGATNANYITNNNQLTNGAGYTTNVGDITGVTAGSYLTGGGTSGTVTLNANATTASTGNTLVARDSSGDINVRLLRSEYDSTNSSIGYIMTQVDTASNNYVRPSTPAQFRAAVTDGVYYPNSNPNGYTSNVGDITGVTAGNGLTGGGTSGTVTLNVVGTNGLTVSADAITLDSDLRGHAWLIGRDTNDYYSIGTTVHDWRLDGNLDMRLENDGDLHVDGDVIAYSTTTSDRRLKDNIKTIDNALEKVEQLRGVEYDWNKGSRKGQHEIGLIAQEVEEVFPFLVKEKVKTTGDFENDDTAYKSVDYEKLVGVLIESVKELSAKVKTLEAKLQ